MGAIRDAIEDEYHSRELREDIERKSERARNAITHLREAQAALRGNGCYSPPRFFSKINDDIEVAVALLTPQVLGVL